VLGTPIGNNKALETQLAFEKTVKKLGVLAGLGVVSAVVTAHDTTETGMDCIGEGPVEVSK